MQYFPIIFVCLYLIPTFFFSLDDGSLPEYRAGSIPVGPFARVEDLARLLSTSSSSNFLRFMDLKKGTMQESSVGGAKESDRTKRQCWNWTAGLLAPVRRTSADSEIEIRANIKRKKLLPGLCMGTPMLHWQSPLCFKPETGEGSQN